MSYNKSKNWKISKMKQSLTKSLVEDASEDFSNIEEHLGAAQKIE